MNSGINKGVREASEQTAPGTITRPNALQGEHIPRGPLPCVDLAGTSLRILVVVRGAETYGTSTQVIGMLESLEGRGSVTQLYAIGDGVLAETVRATLSVSVFLDPAVPPRFEAARTSRLVAFSRTLKASVPLILHLIRHIRRYPCDAIVFCEHGILLPIGLAARLTGKRAFWLMANGVAAGYPFDVNRRIYAFSFGRLAVVPVANSEHTRRTLGRGARYASKIDLGINPDRVAGTPASRSGARQGDRRVRLLVMARLVPIKGQLVLLRAILSRDSFRDIELVVCGGPTDTEYADALRREAAVQNASDRLHLVGPTTDVAPYYASADVVANCRLDPEPFGMSIVEGMFAGKPILAHASGGPADIVVDGVTGWHVDTPTVEGFARGLARMLEDRPNWLSLGQAGMERARLKYTHHAMTDELIEVIARNLRRA